jgi:sarcosine oxidase subunit gamma
VLERHSALASVLIKGGRDAGDGRRSLRIGEMRGWSLVQLAVTPGASSELVKSARSVLGGDLPPRVGEASRVGARLLFRTGPEQFWVVSDEDEDLAPALQSAITPQVGAVTRLSHSRTRIFIEGGAAREVLTTGIAVDLHPAVFPVNAFALAGLHHTPVLVHRSGNDRYELLLLRTFALWLWEWLIDAALPFGYDVATRAP